MAGICILRPMNASRNVLALTKITQSHDQRRTFLFRKPTTSKSEEDQYLFGINLVYQLSIQCLQVINHHVKLETISSNGHP